ncbi:MAG: 4-(cytidine 5'-diphospho)-2-C-methyl-D-erythritol kinase [Candidatus Omnitrophota bacterium]
MIFKFHSPAKLNLFLKIKNRRKDGFHNLETIFERINLCDEIRISINNSGVIKIYSDRPICPLKSNLAYQAALLIKNKFHIEAGINIKIKKIIPIGAGLGGASSNAATVILALNKIFRLKLSLGELLNLARIIGSDVSFFVLNSRFALGLGRGDRLTPILKHKNIKFWHVLVAPYFKNLTSKMYHKFDDYLRLTKEAQSVKIKCLKIRQINKNFLKNNLFNSFESIVDPRIMRIKDKFSQLNVKYRLMSGSGSAVFGIVNSRKEADNIYKQLKKGKVGQVYIVKTY